MISSDLNMSFKVQDSKKKRRELREAYLFIKIFKHKSTNNQKLKKLETWN